MSELHEQARRILEERERRREEAVTPENPFPWLTDSSIPQPRKGEELAILRDLMDFQREQDSLRKWDTSGSAVSLPLRNGASFDGQVGSVLLEEDRERGSLLHLQVGAWRESIVISRYLGGKQLQRINLREKPYHYHEGIQELDVLAINSAGHRCLFSYAFTEHKDLAQASVRPKEGIIYLD